ncbi:nucleoid-associated protein [Pseudomonas sp. VS40]|uniref:nucleoid-associated protein n=1 Tax=unclassified Pseudomonas TaxID=196821 RepID=UPI001BDEB37A|nr:nucleoid-associated protein [Pseudomonas sp. VS40]MBT1271431.1 nucleoid-associated protein [Pseudomonas sp. VS59]
MFENINIERVVIHEVFKRGPNRELVDPVFGEQQIELDAEAMTALRDRLIKALGQSSRCMEMDLQNEGEGSAIYLAKQLIDAGEGFALASQAVAVKLAGAQTRQDLPGGIVVVLTGTAGVPGKRFVCKLKAEPHNGFTRVAAAGVISLQFLKDLILTPQTRLYKIGCFVEMDRDAVANTPLSLSWKAFIYDETMSTSNKLSAAHYFYDGFLGLKFPQNGATRTKEFHDHTKEFIKALDVTPERKNDLLNALVTYLKVDQSPSIQVTEFSQTYFAEPEIRDGYEGFMTQKNFPLTAINKDLAYVEKNLKFRRVVFSQGIKLTGPADQFAEKISIEQIPGNDGADGVAQSWTKVIIKSTIQLQE